MAFRTFVYFVLCFSVCEAATQHARSRRHRKGPPEEASSTESNEFRKSASGANAWEREAAAHGFKVHRPGSALITGAVMYKTAIDTVATVLASEETSRKLRGETDKEMSNMTFVTGFDVQFEEETSGEGTFYAAQMKPGCKVHNEFGDSDCLVKFEEKFTIDSVMYLGQKLGADARLHIAVNTHFDSFLIPDPKSFSVICPICGANCDINYMGKSFTIENSDCPVDVGPYTLYSDSVQIPDNFLLKTTVWRQSMEYTLMADDKHQLMHSRTSISTVS